MSLASRRAFVMLLEGWARIGDAVATPLGIQFIFSGESFTPPVTPAIVFAFDGADYTPPVTHNS